MLDVPIDGKRCTKDKEACRREKNSAPIKEKQPFKAPLESWKKGQLMVTPSLGTFKEVTRHLSTEDAFEIFNSIPCSVSGWGVSLVTSPKVIPIPKDHMSEGHQIKIKSINH